MLLTKTMSAVLLWNNTFRQVVGFGMWNLRFGWLPASLLLWASEYVRRKSDKTVWWYHAIAILPFPTMRRDVSGRKNTISRRQRPESRARSQNIHHHPVCWERAPPRTGPKLGATFGLQEGVNKLHRSSYEA